MKSFIVRILAGIGNALFLIFRRPRVLVVISIILSLGAAGFFAREYQRSQVEIRNLKEDPRSLASEETKRLVEKVGKLIELPEGETPTVATVTDAEKLQNQLFFATTQNGDKVLIYTQAKKALLYRPATNKIINVAPVNIGGEQGQQSPQPEAQVQITPTPTPTPASVP